MTIEDTLGAVLEAKLAPVRAEVGRLSAEIQAMRRALPAPLVTLAEAAGVLGVSLSTIRRRVRDGSIPVRRVGRGRAIRVDLAGLHPADAGQVVELAAEARRVASRNT